MLEVREVSKSFSRKQPPALDEVSFTVERGQICGLLGHNGAGKSTLLGIMLGMVYPDQGEVSIGGCVVQNEREKAMAKVGAIFESPAFYDYLSGWRNLQILTSLSGRIDRMEILETVDRVGLGNRIHDRVGTYSHGMRQRLALAQALLPRPELLLLDEPTDGLDPEGIVEFRERLLDLRDELELTVLLSSHLLGEAGKMCDQFVILKSGQRVFAGRASELSGSGVRYLITAKGLDEVGIAKVISESFSCKLIPGTGIEVEPGLDGAELLRYLVEEKKVAVTSFSPQSDSLEALYLELNSRNE